MKMQKLQKLKRNTSINSHFSFSHIFIINEKREKKSNSIRGVLFSFHLLQLLQNDKYPFCNRILCRRSWAQKLKSAQKFNFCMEVRHELS